MEKVKINEIKNDFITVKYQGKQIQINITEELIINEAILNTQLKSSPSN